MKVELTGGCLDGELYEAPIEDIRNFGEFRFSRKRLCFCVFDLTECTRYKPELWTSCGPGDTNSSLVAVYVPDKMRAEGHQTKVWLKFRRYENL